MRAMLFALSMVLFSCSSGCDAVTSGGDAGGVLPAADAGDGGDGGGDASAGGTRGFAEPCESSDQCKSGICYQFGDGTKGCSQQCTAAEECPSGSQGQKCNREGYCRV